MLLREADLLAWLLDFFGIHFLRFCLDLAHSASVPIAVHLDREREKSA